MQKCCCYAVFASLKQKLWPAHGAQAAIDKRGGSACAAVAAESFRLHKTVQAKRGTGQGLLITDLGKNSL